MDKQEKLQTNKCSDYVSPTRKNKNSKELQPENREKDVKNQKNKIKMKADDFSDASTY